MYAHGRDTYDMPRWSGAAWQPVRDVVMACLERRGRPTAAQVWELLTDFRPEAGTPEPRARHPRTERPLVCAQCGSPLTPDDRFCDACGGDVLTTPPSSAPPDSARASRPEPESGLPSINAYRAYRRLGGSQGYGVYLAHRPGASNDVVIRHAPGGTAQGIGRRLQAEADALRRMAGHYAPRLFVDASSLNPPGLVVECVRLPDGSPAPPLSSLMGRRPDGSPRLDAERAATVGLRIAEAVNMCSLKGVVPGPLTADTVLVTDSTVKLIGWTEASVGDRLPGAPTAADSVYALGQILRDLSDAQPTGELIRTMDLWRNPQLLSTISACLDDRPGRRPSAGRVADVFVQCLTTMSTSTSTSMQMPMLTQMPMSYEAETSDTPQPAAETPDDAEPEPPADPGPAPTTAPEPPPKRSGPSFTRALRSLFQRGGSAPEADVGHPLEQVRLPRTDSCHLTVISRAVGAGRTTTAIALGDVLASAHQGKVIAIDAIPGGDALGRRVQRESQATIQDVVQAVLNSDNTDVSSIRRFTSQTPSGLEVLLGDPRPSLLRDRTPEVNNREYRAVIAALRRRYPVILSASDTGGLRDFVPELLDLTDQLIIVTSPFVERMRSAHTTLDRLIQGGRGDLVQRGIVVLNTHREHPLTDPERLAVGFRVRCRGVVVVPYDQHLAAPGEIDLHRLAPRTLDAYLDIAALVAEGYPGGGD
ncbi:hypothetical protein SSPO_028650 [Streptomyces antimycoticus]|uniref:Uncharacterized protein n=1 Tax=Streptomyces antimycoticus TaxID=68175 RepID=A0A499V1S5_9ACTN|nr:hypothetical protein [Streptomyces antimycoticus]BBJ40147.1 hypothetical protein SSPO_028650 [Streptomyces antimycoticus]